MRPTARLTRITADPDQGTFGALQLLNTPICVTVEPYHRDNAKNISCIPAGVYLCKRVTSPKYGITFEVSGIQGRDKVLIHWGNIDSNTQGCIILGEEFGKLNGDVAVLSSKRAFREFMSLLDGCDEFMLTIVDCF
jgi:hypothetical protein